ncbi:uncharacterized protein N7479_005875 [Penicillium vulpinum]|uniref:Uncharacterized protein n=1 Tax=Penicillium vulpinum TaxID=29845 RepID=A0A1V6SE46_9EURO|nr:uncharacterized protein N7479_005875 [Penicillium vulpinum]KAJ5958725.1 hypothetical protein N7479_005875 [Penicillium vulpinum]OQE12287.1 hypothetical protein PENVUL_c001G01778 [Penicillium vulpinum]
MIFLRTGLGLNGTTSVPGEKQPEVPEKESLKKEPMNCPNEYHELKTNHLDVQDLHPAMTKEMITIFRQKGTDYQNWINYPDDKDCRRPCIVSPSTLKMDELIRPSDDRNQWDAYFNALVDAPEEIGDPRPLDLPRGLDYHKLYLRKLGTEKDGSLGWNKYHGRVAHTAIFADNNVRLDGPQWSQIAQAHYQDFFDIDSLKYVFRMTVVNEETHTFVAKVLYPRYGIELAGDCQLRPWLYDTDDYREIMGTPLGKAVGALVLGAFPRGTRRVIQILTWQFDGDLQMRFDISRIPSAKNN